MIDVHQHLWPEQLIEALARRLEPPMLARGRDGWTLRAPGEADAPFAPADHDADARAALVRADGLELAVLVPSAPLGIESLPEADELLSAYHDGVAELPDEFRAWAAVNLNRPDAEEIGGLLRRGFVGACVPAGALVGRQALERLGPVLELLERRGAPLFVHPGPAAPCAFDAPAWWSAMTDYVSGMQAAWHAWQLHGPAAHPRLRVCFAMLAGLAPLQRERLQARGGPTELNPNSFLDTSSYGQRALDAVLREVGGDALVYGSDRPVIEPVALSLGDAVETAIRTRNPSALLQITTQEVCT